MKNGKKEARVEHVTLIAAPSATPSKSTPELTAKATVMKSRQNVFATTHPPKKAMYLHEPREAKEVRTPSICARMSSLAMKSRPRNCIKAARPPSRNIAALTAMKKAEKAIVVFVRLSAASSSDNDVIPFVTRLLASFFKHALTNFLLSLQMLTLSTGGNELLVMLTANF